MRRTRRQSIHYIPTPSWRVVESQMFFSFLLIPLVFLVTCVSNIRQKDGKPGKESSQSGDISIDNHSGRMATSATTVSSKLEVSKQSTDVKPPSIPSPTMDDKTKSKKALADLDEIKKISEECRAAIEKESYMYMRRLQEIERRYKVHDRLPYSFAIAITPDRCNISVGGGISEHKMVNQCDRKLAFKVRSSNNSNYSVNINSGFIDVAETKEFIITRKAGKPQPDKLIVCFAYATGPDALEHFKADDYEEMVAEKKIRLARRRSSTSRQGRRKRRSVTSA